MDSPMTPHELHQTVDAQPYVDLLARCFARSDALFERLPAGALHMRPIGLRHPFLFYLGHLPAFAWNQVSRALELGPLRAEFDALFERGIDPADAAAAAEVSIARWPDVDAVLAYRDEARRAVLARVPEVLARAHDVLCARGRLLHLIAEHELMHHETLMYMLQELDQPPTADALADGDGQPAAPRRVPAGRVHLGVALSDVAFAWDNELGALAVDVPAFTLDSLPVRNRDWHDFLASVPDSRRAALTPQSWRDLDGALHVQTVRGPAPFAAAAGWPVQVSGAQARAYAAAHGGRLPTEPELRRAALCGPGDEVRAYPWGDAAPTPAHGNFGFHRWTPSPVGSHPAGASAWGVEELVGNGWEWTATPFAPLPGFHAYARTYPGYSTDFFDDAHDIVFGASWATDEKLLRSSFRNWYRRDYPYAFTSFRLVR